MSKLIKLFLCTVWIVLAGPWAATGQAAPQHQSGKGAVERVALASKAGASLDTDLLAGGGSDDTATLQRLLDRAADGKGFHLVVDGPALISGLTVYGKTTIECMAGGGFYLKDGSLGAVIRNAHRSRKAIVDEHIEIRGCFINGNRIGQPRALVPEKSFFQYVLEADGTFRSGLQFFGVRYLSIENVTLWNVHGFHSWIANGKFISIRNVLVDTGIPTFPDQASLAEQKEWTRKHWSNDDGLHFTGPIQYLVVDNAKLRTWDDNISLCANDWGLAGDDITLKNEMGPFVGQGPITDVIINNVIFMDSHKGIRMLSSDQRMDRIVVQNVTGTNRERFAMLSHMANPGRGNFGSITFSNVNVDGAPHPRWSELYGNVETMPDANRIIFLEEDELPLFALNAHIENLQFNAVVTRPVDNRPLIRVGPHAAIGMLKASFSIHDPDARAVPLKVMGRIQRLRLSLDWPGLTPIKYEGGVIERLDWVTK
jgi:hypothetical protein